MCMGDSVCRVVARQRRSVKMDSSGPTVAPGAYVPHVLVAEDGAIQAKLAQKCLEHAQCRVTLVANGKDALDFARAEMPDIVISLHN